MSVLCDFSRDVSCACLPGLELISFMLRKTLHVYALRVTGCSFDAKIEELDCL